ncbi:polycomb group protein Psc-like [Daktulosphaira vitifoliae]|uniref:polycomb group protein Psc-like n=1 Tax=Daktulosphaira vitifoliae TaxID=58002 RepID=UPI0021A99809|nr:polycomb group protein Psc-like [Daktulosphaira vitifoliae]XP_050537053.1 polycomb group protein Psc-like [Daktulosphaira vitifoliae]XP_050537054.1 polycomb group protein Psc-like [Daktulosphaira vitifoliae]
MQPNKLMVTDLNPHLLCVLCGGYFIDATTIIECLHSFCRSCIVKYLEKNKYCPICDVLIHKSNPLFNIRPDHTLQNIVYKLVPKLFQREMIMRKEFYLVNNVHPPQDPLSQGMIPDDYHLFTPNDSVSICLLYENEHSKQSLPITHKRFLWCPASLQVINLKKFVYLKFELTSLDHYVEFSYQNHLLDDHLTLMDVVYMFDWKRKDPLSISYRILTIKREPFVEENVVEKLSNDTKEDTINNKSDIQQNSTVRGKNIDLEENIVDIVSNSKEEFKKSDTVNILNVSQIRHTIKPNVTIEFTDSNQNKTIDKVECEENKKKILKVYPGSKIKKNKPRLDTIVEKIKKQSTKYKTLTSPTKHWNPSISKTSVLAKKKDNNGDKINQKFFKSRDEKKKNEGKIEESLKRLAEVPLMKINPQTLCPIMPSSPAKKSKKPLPKKNTLAQSLALLPVRPANHNPFTSPLNPFMFNSFSNNDSRDSSNTNNFLKAMSELCPPSSAYHNSLPPSVSVLFNPLYAHHRQSQPKKSIAETSDVQKVLVHKTDIKKVEKHKKKEEKDNDECTNNNKGEEKMEIEKT